MIAMIRAITCAGFNLNFVSYSSPYLINPPLDAGIVISSAILKFQLSKYKKFLFRKAARDSRAVQLRIGRFLLVFEVLASNRPCWHPTKPRECELHRPSCRRKKFLRPSFEAFHQISCFKDLRKLHFSARAVSFLWQSFASRQAFFRKPATSIKNLMG